MFTLVIPVNDYAEAQRQIQELSLQEKMTLELRLDYLKTLDFQALATLRAACPFPLIITLRRVDQGGFYPHNEAQRLRDLHALAALNPTYLDLEYDVPSALIHTLKRQYPALKLLGSYHHFHETPRDLPALLQEMQKKHFHAYKIATHALSTLDALRMLVFVKQYASQCALTGLCMGEKGQVTRLLSQVVGSLFTYVSLDEPCSTAPGQFTLAAFKQIYQAHTLTPTSQLYALLGSPVQASIGHIFHNQAIRVLNQNAIYCKLDLTPAELPQAMVYCTQLPFAGFSVTRPLKEEILPLLDAIDPCDRPIGAINTLIRENARWIGFNTDGKGAIQAVAERVSLASQTIAILGAGGAARAIAYEALQQKARVIIINRTLSKAQQLAHEFGCESLALTPSLSFKVLQATIIINTLPGDAYTEKDFLTWLHPDRLLPHTLAMDIVYTLPQTPFIRAAQQAKCRCIMGDDMYINQALHQLARWFQPTPAQLDALKVQMLDFSERALNPSGGLF